MLNRSHPLTHLRPAARLTARLARFSVQALLIVTAVVDATLAYALDRELAEAGEFSTMLWLMFWMLLPVVLITVASLLWSWLLRRQVAHRTRQLQRELGERQQAEAALRESEGRFRDVTEAASDWI